MPLGGAEAQTTPQTAAQARSRAFSPVAEAKKLDAVPTPKLDWYACYGGAQCATVKVPRDYDKPKGAKVELALLRIKARHSKRRIGSLFVNPGGPGGSATEFVQEDSELFSSALRDRFDIVGMDPRGIGSSDNVKCFSSARKQQPALAGHNIFFPMTARQERAWLKSDKAEGRACSKNSLATSMSTAEVARDMELMRRAVGDRKLTYLGFSYGTYLGQVYANMFPDRFRALAVDGVLEPVAWAGNSSNQGQPLEQRLRSSVGGYKALREILKRCDQVGGQRCSFAPGNPMANLALIANRLKRKPLTEFDEFSGETYTFGYPDLVGTMLSFLYDPAGYAYLVGMLTDLYILTEPPARVAAQVQAQGARQKALKSFNQLRRRSQERMQRPRYDFPYDNGFDAFASVTCTDSKETTKGKDFPRYAAQADQRAPYFGRAWMWNLSICASDAFPGEDEDAYRGPFNTMTTKPVLFVGDYYDPATNYDNAVSAAKRMPNSRLLSSDSWGHTAYRTSRCVTSAMDRYLIAGTLPAKGKVCKGDVQPFESDEEALAANDARQEALKGAMRQLLTR